MDICCKVQNKKEQFALSFAAAVIFQFGYSIIMESCNFTVYFLSYIKHKQDWVDMNVGNKILPVVLLFFALFSPLSGTMEHSCGPRISILISSIIIETAFVLLYLQRNFWYFYSLILLLGIGTGLSTQILIKNACCYYPHKKGLINALINSLGGLFGAGCSYLGEKIINPDRKIIRLPNEYYEEDIAKKSRLFFLFAIFLIPISTIISIILIYKYNDEGMQKIETKVEGINGPLIEESNPNDEENQNNENNQIIENNQNGQNRNSQNPNAFNSNHKINIKKAFKSWRFWKNIILVGIMPFMIWFEIFASRAYISKMGVDEKIQKNYIWSTSVLGCISNPIWGIIIDKFGFRPTMIIISFLTFSLSIHFSLFIDHKLIYVICIYCSTFLRSGVISSLIPHIMHIFGLRYYLTLGGLGRMFTQFFISGAASVSIVISNFKKTYDELVSPYRIVSLVGIFCSVIGLFLAISENDDEFQFEEKQDEHAEIEKIGGKKEEDQENDQIN